MTRRLHRAGVPILAGSDTGSTPLVFPGRALHDELEHLVERIGLTPAEALRAATLTPARGQGVEGTLDEVAIGQTADLVLLAANPLEDISATRRIRAVPRGGAHDPGHLRRARSAPGAGTRHRRSATTRSTRPGRSVGSRRQRGDDTGMDDASAETSEFMRTECTAGGYRKGPRGCRQRRRTWQRPRPCRQCPR
jgi:hypothetical protein